MDATQRTLGLGHYLILSSFEIERVLSEVMRKETPVSVTFGQDEQLIVTTIAQVDREADAVLLYFGPDKAINQKAIHSDKLTFTTSYEQRKVQFVGHKPVDTSLGGQVVFKVRFPDALLNLQRRTSERIQAPAINPPKVEIRHPQYGKIVATVHDISLGGVGMIDYDVSAYLAPGTLLQRCRIHFPDLGVSETDIEVRYTIDVPGEQGKRMRRSGCEFQGNSADLEKLLDSYIIHLRDRGAGASGNA